VLIIFTRLIDVKSKCYLSKYEITQRKQYENTRYRVLTTVLKMKHLVCKKRGKCDGGLLTNKKAEQ
jgi:hypothetical protein